MSARETTTTPIVEEAQVSATVPAEVEFVLSAMEAAAAANGRENRRSGGRSQHRATALLRLYSDPDGAQPAVIYTRDVCARSLGFITKHRLPLGYGGMVELIGRDGRVMQLDCTLLRCRESTGGWYEGAMYFNRQQKQFDDPAFAHSGTKKRTTSHMRLVAD